MERGRKRGLEDKGEGEEFRELGRKRGKEEDCQMGITLGKGKGKILKGNNFGKEEDFEGE